MISFARILVAVTATEIVFHQRDNKGSRNVASQAILRCYHRDVRRLNGG